MAIIEAISSKANIKKIISYVTQDKKTNVNLLLIYGAGYCA